MIEYTDEQHDSLIRGHRKQLADAQATVEALQRERDTARRRVDELEAREVDVVLLRDDLDAERDRLREALEQLAILGNEPYYGNSDGNRIAQKALGIDPSAYMTKPGALTPAGGAPLDTK